MKHEGIDQDTAQALKVLRQRIEDSNVPSSILDEQILVASWNIREFGRKARTDKAIHLIAEILSYFDLISIQELRGQLGDLREVLEVLGPHWRVVFSDVTLGGRGNEERIGYLFDKRAVTFTGLAAEAVVAPVEEKVPTGKKTKTGKPKVKIRYRAAEQFWRTPYIASFRAGSFDFVLITVHAAWGNTDAERLADLGALADWVEAYRTSKFVEDKDLIVMGDFNIPAKDDKFYQAITRHKLEAPDAVLGVPGGSNIDRDARYDQIFFCRQHTTPTFAGQGGVLDFFAKDHKPLFPDLSKTKFTYQLSDHLPLWIVVNTDVADEQLDFVLKRKGGND